MTIDEVTPKNNNNKKKVDIKDETLIFYPIFRKKDTSNWNIMSSASLFYLQSMLSYR